MIATHMLTPAELAMAEKLYERLRELTRPPEPEHVRDGQPLANLLEVSRTKGWEITKRPDFNEAAPAIVLGPKLRMRKRRQVLAWAAAQKEVKENPALALELQRGVQEHLGVQPPGTSGTNTNTTNQHGQADGYARKRKNATTARAR
jgi:hypothetical protein